MTAAKAPAKAKAKAPAKPPAKAAPPPAKPAEYIGLLGGIRKDGSNYGRGDIVRAEDIEGDIPTLLAAGAIEEVN